MDQSARTSAKPAEREKTMKAQMQTVKRITLPDQVVAVLRKEIFTGVYSPGENLPSERELAERFGVSRITLRKALAVLAQEGWIEIVQGRGNTVLDFRTHVGAEVLPELFLSCPEAFINPQIFETIVANSAGLNEQILLAAAKKAKPEDEARLLEILARQTEAIELEEFFENDFSLIRELLRIGDNLILQMASNAETKLSRRVLARGLVKERPFPNDVYLHVNRLLIQAVCARDADRVRSLLKKNRKALEEGFLRFFKNLVLEHKGRLKD